MKELLEAGVHFGHQTKRWNPKMKEYIFGERNGIYIIDLQKTLKMFKEASKFVQDMAAAGKVVLFVGTKRQAQDAIAEEAQRCSMFYINQRWLGGLLTNFQTISKRIKRLHELREWTESGSMDLLPVREKAHAARKQAIELLAADSIDRGAIEALRAEHIVLAEQASKRFAQALADVAEVLTPAQRKQIAERMESLGRRWRHG